jgi:hypothetical protein
LNIKDLELEDLSARTLLLSNKNIWKFVFLLKFYFTKIVQFNKYHLWDVENYNLDKWVTSYF